MRESYKSMLVGVKSSLDRLMKSKSRFVTSRDEEEAHSLWMPLPVIPALGCVGMFDLSLLMDFQRRRRPDAERITEGWFKCPAKELLEAYGPHLANLEKQTRLFNRLEELGFIKRMVKGKPPIRYIWIDYDKVLEECGKRANELAEAKEEELV